MRRTHRRGIILFCCTLGTAAVVLLGSVGVISGHGWGWPFQPAYTRQTTPFMAVVKLAYQECLKRIQLRAAGAGMTTFTAQTDDLYRTDRR